MPKYSVWWAAVLDAWVLHSLLLGVWLLGCGRGLQTTEEQVVLAPEFSRAALVQKAGDVRIGGRALATDEIALTKTLEVESETSLEVRGAGFATLDFPRKGVLTLEGDSILRLRNRTNAYLLRGSFLFNSERLGTEMGGSSRIGIRLVAPSMWLQISGAAQIFVAVREDGSSFVGVLSGTIDLSNGEADAVRNARTTSVAGGQCLLVSGGTTVPRLLEPVSCMPDLASMRQERDRSFALIEPAAVDRKAKVRDELLVRCDESLALAERERLRSSDPIRSSRTLDLVSQERSAELGGRRMRGARLLAEVRCHRWLAHLLLENADPAMRTDRMPETSQSSIDARKILWQQVLGELP